MKKAIIFFTIFVFYASLFAQGYAVDKGASIISGLGSFVSEGNAHNKVRTSLLSTAFTYNYFVYKHVFLGSGLGLNCQFGHDGNISYNFGPQLGIAFGSEYQNVYPFNAIGIKYCNTGKSNDYAPALILGAGLIIKIKDHIGFIIEVDYEKYIRKDIYDFDVVLLSFGFSGLLYREVERGFF